MQKFSKWNAGYRYLLMIIDVFSKYGWIVPLKDKKGKTVTKAFDVILKIGGTPKFLWTDKGKEFYNKDFKELLKRYKITLYSTENEEKSSVVERWNRTMKNIMYKYFTAKNTYKYIDVLKSFVHKYNNTKHRSIGMTPTEASLPKNERIVYSNLYKSLPKRGKSKFVIGDKVRISKYKGQFPKGYLTNWSEEIFTVYSMQNTTPYTYKIRDLDDEEIKGTFYAEELQRVRQDIFRIEKVIRRDNKKKMAFVKWKGYPLKFNSWIPMKNLKKI